MANYINHQQARQGIESAIARRQYNNSFEGSVKNTIQNALVKKIGFETLEKDQESIAKRLQENAERVEAGEYVDPKEYDSLVADSENVGKRLAYYRNYIRNAAPDQADAIKNATDMSKAFLDASKSMGEQQKFFSAFKDADDYKKQMDAYKEQQRLTFEYDLEAGKKLLDAAKGTDEYDALEEEYNLAKYYQDAYNYDKLSENEDFEKKSKKANSTWDIGETARAADFINGAWHAEAGQAVNKFIDGLIPFLNNDTTEAYERYKLMDESEVATFNYLYNTKGQKEAQKYLDFIDKYGLQSEYAQKNKTKNWLTNIMRAIDSGGERIINGILNVDDMILHAGADLVNWESAEKYFGDKLIDSVQPSNSLLALSARQQDAGFWEGLTYDLAANAPQQLVNIGFSALLGKDAGGLAASITLGISEGTNAYAEALADGEDNLGRRLAYAVGMGAMEGVTNKLLDGTLEGSTATKLAEKITSNISNAVAHTIVTYGAKGLSEGFEESLQEVLGTVIGNVTLDKNDEVWNWKQIGYSGLVGILSANIMNSPTAAANLRLPENSAKSYHDTFDLADVEGTSFDTRFSVFKENYMKQDETISAKVISEVESGNAESAYKTIDEAIKGYKYAKEYSRQKLHRSGNSLTVFDDPISHLETMKKLIKDGKFNTEAAKTATMQNTTIWQVAAENNDTAAKVLLQDGLSNTQIEKTVLTDKGTQKAFERLTGVNLSQYKTVSQKRNAVKVTAEAYKAFASSDAAAQVTDILKANNTISDATVRSENRVKAQKILEAAYKEASAEDTAARNSGNIDGAKIAQAKMKLIDHVKNDVRNGNAFSFASLDGSAAVNNARKTQSAPKAEKQVQYTPAVSRDLAEAPKGVNEEYLNLLDAEMENGSTFTEAEKEVLGNIDGKIEKAEGDEKTELIEQKKKLEEYLNLERASFEEIRDANKQFSREILKKRTAQHKKTLKQYGIDLELESGGELFYDENKNLITEEEYDKLKKQGKKVSVVYQDGIHTTQTIRIFECLSYGHLIRTLDMNTGEIISLRSGIDISAKSAVDFVVGHEAVHEGESVGSGIVNSILNSISNTKLDSYYEIGKRRSGKETSKDADAHWNALKELYIKAEMKNGTRAEAEAKVTDAYMYEEIAADYMGMLLVNSENLDSIMRKRSLWTKIKVTFKSLISRLKGYKLDTRAERVKELMKKLDAAVQSTYGKQAKSAENAQKSTESEAKTEAEQTPAKAEKRAENDEKMSVAGELDESLDDVIDLSLDTELATIVDGVYGSQKYKRIAQYILDVLGNEEIILSDGRKAIVDKSDAMHIANKAAPKKTAKIAKIREIIQKARIYAQDTNAEHNKFDQFYYYVAKVKLGDETFPVYLNVGKAKNDGSYHIYDITNKIKDTADRINGLERPKPNEGYALKNGIFDNSISQPSKNVNGKFSLSPETDSEYLSAVENGDMETAQRMVDEAAKAAGYTSPKLYHGTNAKFNVFNNGVKNGWLGKGIYFAEDRGYARENGKRIVSAYVNMQNPFVVKGNSPNDALSEIKAKYPNTDEFNISEVLEENGYDGVVFTHWDNGKIISVFNSEQIKSADPVTYDDNGNVIPLSERFNEGNEDIRYSISPSLDSDIDSVLNGTFDASRNEVYLGETSQFMTDVIGANALSLYMPASKVYSSILTREDYNKKPYYKEQDNYHGIGKEDFIDVLERSENPIAAFAAAPDEKGNKRLNRIVLVTDKIIKDADTGEEGYAVVVEEVDSIGRNQGKTFKANKAITVYERTHLISDIQMAIADGRLLAKTKKGERLLNMRRGSNPQATIREDVLKKNIANFWANVKWNNQKNKIYSSSVTPTTTAMEDAIKNSSYYKSMQNSENDTEGRMSVTEEVTEESEQTYAELKREAEKLKQRNVKLAHEFIRTHGKEVDPKSATKLLNEIIEKYQGTIKAKDILAKFEEVYTYANTKGANVDELMRKLNDIATDIFNSAVEYEDVLTEYRSLLKELRETGITVSVEDRGGDFDDVGGWNEFRKKSIGNVKFVNDGLPVDSYYQELSTQYPHLFDEKITSPAEQAKEIASVARKLREIGVTPKDVYAGVDEEIVLNGIMGDLYSALKDADKKATFADKAAQKVHDAYLAEKMHYGAKIAELKRKNKKREQIIVEKFESRIDRLTEDHHKAYQEKMVRSRAKDIAKRLTRPTKTKHVPAMMAGDVGAFLSKIRWASDNVGRSEYAAEMRELLAKAPKENTKESDDANTFSQDLLDDMRDFAPGKTVEEMSAKEAYELNVLLMRMIHEINYQDKLFHSTVSASALASKAITQFTTSRKDREFAHIWNRLIDFIRYGAADPESFFHALGVPALTETYQNLAKQQDVFARTLRELTGLMKEIVNGSIPKSWREDYNEYTLANGQKIHLTPVQKMTLYLLSKQEASKKRLLSERGGIVPTATERNFVWRQNENGKEKVRVSVPKTTLGKRVYLTEGDLIMLEGTLSKEQIDIANKISELLNGRCAELGNEVSLAEEGYRKFIVENYFPMMVAETGKTFELLANSAKEQIAHKSFTKDRTGTAGVPLVVDDIFNVMDRHILGVSQYYAYDKALRDFQRVWKLRPEGKDSLNLTVDQHYGNGKSNKVSNFVANFIKDVQGAQMPVGEETLLSEKFLSAYKAAQVAGNLSVVAKQPTAIFRAMPEFSAKGIAAMMNFATTKADIKAMIENSGLAQFKSWGFSENTTAKSVAELYDKNATNLRGKIDDVFSFLAEQADMVTWAAIWRASVAETKTLAEAVDKFNEVIRKTQVVKSAFTSSRITEQPGLYKLAFAFKNEPLKTFNYIRSTINDVAEGKEGAKKKALAVTVATAINTAVVAAISAGFSLLRDDEENTDELFLQKFKENVIADLVSNSTIMLGDIWTAVESAMNGKTVERMDLAVFTDATEFVLNFVDMMKKPESEQRNTWMKIFYDGARTVSNFTGIPIGNVIRALKSVHGSIVELSDDPVARYNMTKIWYNVEGVDNASIRAKFRSILTDALDDGKYKAFAEINNDLRRHGFSAADIQKSVSNSARLYDAWNEGAEAFRTEVNKAMKDAPFLSSVYVMDAFKSKKTSLVNDLYDAMKSGSKKATSDAMSALLKHRDVDTKRVLTEKDVDKLITKKIESAIKSEVKSKLADLYGTESYDDVKTKILNEYRHFEVITSEYIDKLARSLS